MTQIFTSAELSAGRVFEFYCDEKLSLNNEIEIWTEREREGLGDPIVYGKARVIELPYRPEYLYKALVLSGENCN